MEVFGLIKICKLHSCAELLLSKDKKEKKNIDNRLHNRSYTEDTLFSSKKYNNFDLLHYYYSKILTQKNMNFITLNEQCIYRN